MPSLSQRYAGWPYVLHCEAKKKAPWTKKVQGAGSGLFGGLELLGDDLGQVHDLQGLVHVLALGAVHEHVDAVGAAGGHHLGALVHRLAHLVGAEALLGLGLHPQASAAAAAAHGHALVVAELHALGAAGVHELAGLVEHLAVPAQVAGVVVDDLLSRSRPGSACPRPTAA